MSEEAISVEDVILLDQELIEPGDLVGEVEATPENIAWMGEAEAQPLKSD